MQLKPGSVTSTLNNGDANTLSDNDLTSGLQISTLAKTDNYVVRFAVTMTDQTLIDTEIAVEARLIFGPKTAGTNNVMTTTHFFFNETQLAMEICNTGPCKHGGTCVAAIDGTKSCECTEHYAGPECSQRKKTMKKWCGE